MNVAVLVISGSMGSGKTTVMVEASDILTARGAVHAAIDLDALGIVHLPLEPAVDLTYRNLASIWANYAAAGVNRLLVAGAIESRAELDRLRATLPDSQIVVCRLRASVETMQQRVRVREPGMLQAKLVARVLELETALDLLRIEDFSVSNDGRSITTVANEILERAGWL